MACCKCVEHKWADPQEPVWTDPADGEEYCVFHAPKEHKVDPDGNALSVDDFNALISERIQATVDLEDEEALCDLSGIVFPGDVCFQSNCPLPLVSFCGARFEGCADFKGVCFEKVSFCGTEIHGHACYDFVQFIGASDFGCAKFCEAVTFCGSHFYNYVCFFGTRFHKKTSFSEATFDGEVDFRGGACFEGDVGFDFCVFNGPVFFVLLNIREGIRISFFFSMLRDTSVYFFNCPQFCKAKVSFNGVLNVANLHFENCEWPEEQGRIKVAEEDEPGQLQATRSFYQRMKRKYKDDHNEYEASRWHIAEKEAQLKLLRQNGSSRFLFAMLWIYKQVSGFGENPLRGIVWLLGLIFIPLVVLIGAEAYNHFAWLAVDWDKANLIAKEWLRYLPLSKAEALQDMPGFRHAGMLLWQLLITIQAALFAFALRNRFRR